MLFAYLRLGIFMTACKAGLQLYFYLKLSRLHNVSGTLCLSHGGASSKCLVRLSAVEPMNRFPAAGPCLPDRDNCRRDEAFGT